MPKGQQKMKRVGSIKQALKAKSNTSINNDAANNNESKMSSSGVSILGTTSSSRSPQHAGQIHKPDFHLPKSISSFLKKGTLTRNKKDKVVQVCLFSSLRLKKEVKISFMSLVKTKNLFSDHCVKNAIFT